MQTKKYEIKWEYYLDWGNIKNGFHAYIPTTECKVIEITSGGTVGCGKAKCSIRDDFCKNTGRKLSLARAMKNAGLSKEERKELWEVYKNSKPGGRW